MSVSNSIPYQGSNAEYIVLQEDGSNLSEEKYLSLALPVLRTQFPRTQEIESKLTPIELDRLNDDEVGAIDQALANQHLKALKIPKTLYDMFFMAFRFDQAVDAFNQQEKCKATQSLKRFISPPASVNKYQKDLIASEKTIEEAFVKVDKDLVVSKVDFELNQYIAAYLNKNNISELQWADVKMIYEDLRKHILEIHENNSNIFDTLYSGECLSGTNCSASHRNHSIYRIFRNFSETNHVLNAAIVKALWQEYSERSSIFTLYRGGDLTADNHRPLRDAKEKSVHSISYGQSLFSSSEMDFGGAGAIPIEFIREYGNGYCLKIDKRDYRNGVAGQLFVIPPAQRTARFRLDGEMTHARSRIFHEAPTESIKVSGMQWMQVTKVPFIMTQGDFKTREQFNTVLGQYITENGLVIT
jgi:hypothetical protein